MQQIVPNVYTFTGLIMGRVYLLQDDDGLTIVDSSLSGAGEKILAQLQAAGHQPTDVKRILLTHVHPDHVGGLKPLHEATGAEIWCHPKEKPVMEGDIPVPGKPDGLRFPTPSVVPVPVSHTTAEGDTLPVLGGLQVIDTPGHAPGHISFWQPEQRLLIVGDVIFNVFNRMTLPLPMATVDMEENKRSVKKLQGLQPQMMLFGHGPVVVEQASARLDAFIQRLGL